MYDTKIPKNRINAIELRSLNPHNDNNKNEKVVVMQDIKMAFSV